MAHDTDAANALTDVPPAAYRRDDRISRARIWLPLGAILAAGAWWGVEHWCRGAGPYSPGPLAAVHASWETRCEVCHVDARPLGGENWLAVATGQAHVADAQCTSCHAVPVHHAREEPGAVPACAACHREHRGPLARLTRVADDMCTSCHRDLDLHYRGGTSQGDRVHGVVTSFNRREHPEFGATRAIKDPGTIAFNHKLHLSAGLSNVPDPVAPFTLDRLPPATRSYYRRWARPDGVIQLDCASCHHPDGQAASVAGALDGLPASAVRPARSDGALMQPILYERDCQACHPLSIPRGPKEPYAVRHRLQPAELEEVLRGYYTGQFLKGALGGDAAILTRPLPGKNPQRADERKTARDVIDRHVAADTALLLGASTCQKCHPSLAADRTRVEPGRMPQVWFERAKFDHAAHRGVACLDCHAGAAESQRSTDVLLPGIAVCVKCHAPLNETDAVATGGARFDCVECHRYHDGDHPLHGRPGGAIMRANEP
jgi:predicted CXXCH cytochrome family protein